MTEEDRQEGDGRNVFQMFVAHEGPGFWVCRTTWGRTCARVVRVGELRRPGPYFGNPSVLVDVYSLEGDLKDEAAQLLVSGTFKTWRQIEPPAWAATADLRPLDDPSLDHALARLDKKRHKAPKVAYEGPEPARVWLEVPFARKDEAKKLGARWSSTDKAWWLPETNATAISEARRLGLLAEANNRGNVR